MPEKHFLVHGALCTCSQGAKPDKLVVLSHNKEYINDADGSQKLIANTLDIGLPFETKTFGACAQMSGSACVPAVTMWTNFYKNIRLSNGGNILTEDSKAVCSVSGTPSASCSTVRLLPSLPLTSTTWRWTYWLCSTRPHRRRHPRKKSFPK